MKKLRRIHDDYQYRWTDRYKITECFRFHTYFHYTITAYGKEIEPGVPGIDESISTLIKLSEIVGAERIAWRYDPVLLTNEYTLRHHLETFERIAVRLSAHIDRCIKSLFRHVVGRRTWVILTAE